MEPRENLLRAIRRDRPQWVPNGMESVVTLPSPVCERPGASACDAFGVHWSLRPEAAGGTFPTHGGGTITDLARWEQQLHLPDLEALDWADLRERAAAVDRSQMLVRGFVEMGLFERSYLLLGTAEALIEYQTRPGLMGGLLAAIADYKIALIQRFDEECDLDMLWYGDDWGTQEQLFMRPEIWRQTIRPPTQRIHAELRRRRILIDQHSCGRVESVFEDIVDMGVDLFNPCQPCNDLARLKRQFGDRIAFCGGIDSQFVLARQGVTLQEVRAEVRRRIDEMAPGGGYIAAPSHGVPYSPQIVAAMNDEIATYGRRIYAA
jgi:hypothetical protein